MSDEVQRSLGRIEGKLDALVSTMTSHATNDDVRFANITVQLEDLKQTKWFNGGRASAIAAGVSTAVSIAVLWLKGH